MARWSGWGAAGQLFDKDEFAEQRATLQELLTPQQFDAARRSTTNAHYTDAALATAIWDGLQRLGFTGGEVLEPGCGSGHFIGLAPDSARLTGVEREPVSAAIAAALYPDASVVTGSFARIDAAEGTFDAAVGNVPFAKVVLNDPKHNTGHHSIHNHFIIKALRLTRPGGMVAVLTSRYTMDARNPGARREMAALADLVGAVRLPSGAHRRAAGTEAVTDLLILRRRADGTDPMVPGETWEKALPVPVGDEGSLVEINTYFTAHPEHVLGEFTLEHGMYHAEDLRVRGDLDQLTESFTAAVRRIADEAQQRGLVITPRTETTARPATNVTVIDPDAARFQGSLAALPDGTFTRREGSADVPYHPPGKQADELEALLAVRDVAMALVRAEQASIDDTPQIHDLRLQLNEVYDAYVNEFGPINRFTERRQMRQAWHVFGEWCDTNGHEKLPASPSAVSGYLTHLRTSGLGRDQLHRHLSALIKSHTTAFNKAVEKAARWVAEGRANRDPGIDAAMEAEELLRTARPQFLLGQAKMPDLRLPEASLAVGRAIVAAAPETTPKDFDFDALGLRTTIIVRPPQGGFREDPFSNVARALERFDPTSQTARKADIFTRRVINPPRTRYGADTPEEALSICLDTHSRIDLTEIARLMGLPGEPEARAALDGLVFDDPENDHPVWAPFYLAGNVRQKLAVARVEAEQDARFAVNVTALEKVIPPDLGPEDIEVRLGSWIGPEYVQAFLSELLTDEKVLVESVAGMWLVATDKAKQSKATRLAAEEIWAGGGLDAYELTERLLVGAPIRVTKTVEVPGPNGDLVEREVLDQEATEEAADKAVEISDRFADWVWEDTKRAARVMRVYNDTFNAEIPVDYSGISLSLPGLSQAFALREHQMIAVARVIYQGGTGLVHEVGAGKTLEMIVGIMERHRRGLAHKPVVVVPNDSIAEQFEREWLQAYPGARLLTGRSSDLANDKKRGRNGRAEFVARVATGEWDAVIMTKESFQSIPLPAEIQENFLGKELAYLREEKEAHAANMSQSMTKRIETAMDNAEQRLEARMDAIQRDTAGMTFTDAGFDFIIVDEAQNYKNGMILSAIPDLAIDGSNRALDLDMKLQHLQELHGSARVVLATATPWTGKFSEVYLWQRRLGHDMPRFDTWARTYVTQETYLEMTPGGALRPKSRTRRVINEPELWRSLRMTSDIKMKQDLNLKVPRLRDGKIEIIEVPASVEARIFTLDLARRENNLRGKPEKGEDNHLVIAHDGQMGATDLRTVGITTAAPQKVDVVAEDVFAEWSAAKDNFYLRDDGTEHPVRGGLILVFCDESTPSRHWNFYTELREQLVARGMDETSIRFIHEATSPQRKADLLASAREGAVSVLIGSTMKMGAGINVQTRVIGGYEITGQWRPDITAQAIGRAERQGNQNPEYFWKRVVLAPSMDAKKWEITAQKHNMFAPLYSSIAPERTREVKTEEADSLADVMAAATGDPRYKEKAELDTELKALHRQRSSHGRTQQALKLSIARSTERIPHLGDKIVRQEAVAAKLVDVDGDKFSMRVGKRTFAKRTEAAEAMRELLWAAFAATPLNSKGTTVQVGSIGGFDFTAACFPLNRPEHGILVKFHAAEENTVGFYLDAAKLPGGIGPVTRLENQLTLIAGAAERTRAEIVQEHASIEQAKEAVGKPFAGEQRLADVVARRSELIAQLRTDDDLEDDPDEDRDSPEAIARRERAEARRLELETLAEDARTAAALNGFTAQDAGTFASWFTAIAGPVTAEQRPPTEPALNVWRSIGTPDAGGRTRLQPPGASTQSDDEASFDMVEPALLPVPQSSRESAPLAADQSVEKDDEASDELDKAPASDAADTVLDSLGFDDADRVWSRLQQEIADGGYLHVRRDGVGAGGVDDQTLEVITDSGYSLAQEIRSLAEHVGQVRETLNTPAAAESIDALLASDAARHASFLPMVRAVVDVGFSGSAGRWAAQRLQHVAAMRGIAAAAAVVPAAELCTPNGKVARTDADLVPWVGYTRSTVTYGHLDIELSESPRGREAEITPSGHDLPSTWITLPTSAGEDGTRIIDAITTAITTADQVAEQVRGLVIRELARRTAVVPPPGHTEQTADPTVAGVPGPRQAADSVRVPPSQRPTGGSTTPPSINNTAGEVPPTGTQRPISPHPPGQRTGKSVATTLQEWATENGHTFTTRHDPALGGRIVYVIDGIDLETKHLQEVADTGALSWPPVPPSPQDSEQPETSVAAQPARVALPEQGSPKSDKPVAAAPRPTGTPTGPDDNPRRPQDATPPGDSGTNSDRGTSTTAAVTATPQRVLTVHFSQAAGGLILGTDKTDNIGDRLRPLRAGWKWLSVSHSPDGVARAWALPKSHGVTGDVRKMNRFHHRVYDQLTRAATALSKEFTVALDVHDVPENYVQLFETWRRRNLPTEQEKAAERQATATVWSTYSELRDEAETAWDRVASNALNDLWTSFLHEHLADPDEAQIPTAVRARTWTTVTPHMSGADGSRARLTQVLTEVFAVDTSRYNGYDFCTRVGRDTPTDQLPELIGGLAAYGVTLRERLGREDAFGALGRLVDLPVVADVLTTLAAGLGREFDVDLPAELPPPHVPLATEPASPRPSVYARADTITRDILAGRTPSLMPDLIGADLALAHRKLNQLSFIGEAVRTSTAMYLQLDKQSMSVDRGRELMDRLRSEDPAMSSVIDRKPGPVTTTHPDSGESLRVIRIDVTLAGRLVIRCADDRGTPILIAADPDLRRDPTTGQLTEVDHSPVTVLTAPSLSESTAATDQHVTTPAPATQDTEADDVVHHGSGAVSVAEDAASKSYSRSSASEPVHVEIPSTSSTPGAVVDGQVGWASVLATSTDIGEVLGLAQEEGQWLFEQFLVLAQVDIIRDSVRNTSGNVDLTLRTELNRVMATPLAALADNAAGADTVAVSVARRFADDPGFAEAAAGVGLTQVVPRVHRDQQASLADRVAGWATDLETGFAEQDIFWVQRWIATAAGDPSLVQIARVNARDQADPVLDEKLQELVAAATLEPEGAPPSNTVLDVLLENPASFVQQRWYAVAKDTIYDVARGLSPVPTPSAPPQADDVAHTTAAEQPPVIDDASIGLAQLAVSSPRGAQRGEGGRLLQLVNRPLAAAAVATAPWATRKEAVEHLRGLGTVPKDTVRAFANARTAVSSPSGALWAWRSRYTGSGHEPGQRWFVVHVASGTQVGSLLREDDWYLRPEQLDKPGTSDHQFHQAVHELPDSAIGGYLDGLERLIDASGHRIDWTRPIGEVRQAIRRWRDLEPDGTLPAATDQSRIRGGKGLRAAAVLHVAADVPETALAMEFREAAFLVRPSAAQQIGGRWAEPVGTLLESVARDLARADFRNRSNPQRDSELRAADRESLKVLRLAGVMAFDGRPAQAVEVLTKRVDQIAGDDDAYELHAPAGQMLRLVVDEIAELFAPVPTELERLLQAQPGDVLAWIGSLHVEDNSSLCRWRVVGKPERMDRVTEPKIRVTADYIGEPATRVELRIPVGSLNSPHAREIEVHYPNRHVRRYSTRNLAFSSVDTWAMFSADESLPTSPDQVKQQSRRATRAYLQQHASSAQRAVAANEPTGIASPERPNLSIDQVRDRLNTVTAASDEITAARQRFATAEALTRLAAMAGQGRPDELLIPGPLMTVLTGAQAENALVDHARATLDATTPSHRGLGPHADVLLWHGGQDRGKPYGIEVNFTVEGDDLAATLIDVTNHRVLDTVQIDQMWVRSGQGVAIVRTLTEAAQGAGERAAVELRNVDDLLNRHAGAVDHAGQSNATRGEPDEFGLSPDHPAVRLVRDADARIPEAFTDTRTRHHIAYLAVRTYVTTPAAVIDVVDQIAKQREVGPIVLPRSVQVRPAAEWPAWQRSLQQSARVLKYAGGFDELASWVTEAADEVGGRIAQLATVGERFIADVGTAAVELVPADQPGAPTLARQLKRAQFSYRATREGSLSAHRAVQVALTILRRTNTDPKTIAAAVSSSAGIADELLDLATVVEAAGYTAPIGKHTVAPADLFREAAAELKRKERPAHTSAVVDDEMGPLQVPEVEGVAGIISSRSVDATLARLTADEPSSPLLAHKFVLSLDIAVQRAAAELDRVDTKEIQRGLAAMAEGDRARAQLHLCWALPDSRKGMPTDVTKIHNDGEGMDPALGIVHKLLSRDHVLTDTELHALTWRVSPYRDGQWPDRVAVQLAGWSDVLRKRAGTRDNLAQLLRFVSIEQLADRLYQVATIIAPKQFPSRDLTAEVGGAAESAAGVDARATEGEQLHATARTPVAAATATVASATPTPVFAETTASADFGLTVEHPAVAAVRDAIARAPHRSDPAAAQEQRHKLAAAALDLYVVTPEGTGARLVVQTIVDRTGPGDLLLPRWLERRPAVEWPHWVRTLHQCVRIVELVGGLDVLEDRLRQAASVLSVRIEELAGKPEDLLADRNMAAIKLMPSEHPAAPSLMRQLDRARFAHRVTGEDHRRGAKALDLLEDMLERPELTVATIASRAANGEPNTFLRSWNTVTGLRMLADVVDAAGYTELVPGRDATAPQVFRQVADVMAALLENVPKYPPKLIQEVPAQVPTEPRAMYDGERIGPVDRALREMIEGEGEDIELSSATELAASAVNKGVRAALRCLAEADQHRIGRGLTALDAGNIDEAHLHLSWALPNGRAGLRGFEQAQEILQMLLSRSQTGTPATLLQLARYPISYYDDSPPLIAASLVGWSAALRVRAASGDDLARLVNALPVRAITDDLDAVAALMARQRGFVLPKPEPISGTQESLFDTHAEATRQSTADQGQTDHALRDDDNAEEYEAATADPSTPALTDPQSTTDQQVLPSGPSAQPTRPQPAPHDYDREQDKTQPVDAPVLPTLRGLRRLAAEHDLAVKVVLVGDATFVTIHEPAAPRPPVLSYPVGELQIIDGAGRRLPVNHADGYLVRYRATIPPDLVTAHKGLRDAARRLAQLTPHMLPGPGHHDSVRDLVDEAIAAAHTAPKDAEDLLRQAEDQVGPLVLTPERELEVVRAIRDLAGGYAKLDADVGRYLTAPGHLDGSWQEWTWINDYIRANPDAVGDLPIQKVIRDRDEAERAAARERSEAMFELARAAHKARDHERTLDLLDQAELANPADATRFDNARHNVQRVIERQQASDLPQEPGADPPPSPGAGRDTAVRQAAEPALITPEHQIATWVRINEETARWFEQQFDASPVAQNYLEGRLGSRDAVARVRAAGFSIGYAPRGWTNLVDHLRTNGFRDPDLIDAGVARLTDEKPPRIVDRFFGRVMFAIRDAQGRIAGFTGRALSDDVTAKYLNTPTTSLFQKSELLYGFAEQHNHTAHAVPVAVEGPIDVLAIVAKLGPDWPLMPVAACGTALNVKHFNAIDAMVPRERGRILALDPNTAGRRATLALAKNAVRRYHRLFITTLPRGLDPADWALAAADNEHLTAYRGEPHTRPALDILAESVVQEREDQLESVEGRIGAAREIADLLATVEPDRVTDLALRMAIQLDLVEQMPGMLADARSEHGALPPAVAPTVHKAIDRVGDGRHPTDSDHPVAPQFVQGPDGGDTQDAESAENDYTVVSGMDERIDPSLWGWQHTDSQNGELGVTEVWQRGDWAMALTWSPNDQLITPLYLQTSRMTLDENAEPVSKPTPWEAIEAEISTAAQFREILSEAGRYGWAEPAARPGGWWRLTSTPTSGVAQGDVRSEPERRPVALRTSDNTWLFADTEKRVPLAKSAPILNLPTRAEVTTFVLGRHRRDREIRSLVKAVLIPNRRASTAPDAALARLATIDQQLYQRVAAAAAGVVVHVGGRTSFDPQTAQHALQRLLEGDPTVLPAEPIDPQQPTELKLGLDHPPTPIPIEQSTAREQQVDEHVAKEIPGQESGLGDRGSVERPSNILATGVFPVQFNDEHLTSREVLAAALRQQLQDLPRQIDGQPAGPVRLALTVAASILLSGTSFAPTAIARRVVGHDALALHTAGRIRQLSSVVVERLPDPAVLADRLGSDYHGQNLAEHLMAIAAAIEQVAQDPVAVARARAAALFNSLTDPSSILAAHHAIQQGESDAAKEFFGTDIPSNLNDGQFDPAALRVLRDAFIAYASRSQFKPNEHGRRLVDAGNGWTTAVAVLALAAEGRTRLRALDSVAQALRAAGMAVISSQLAEVAEEMAAEGGFARPDGSAPATTQPELQSDPLLPSDIAIALRGMSGQVFAELIRGMGSGAVPSSYHSEGWRPRSADEPDPGAGEWVEFTAKGVSIEIETDSRRAGDLTWKGLQAWLEAGITPSTRQLLFAADAAADRFQINASGFTVIGEGHLCQAAQQELEVYRHEAVVAIVDRALATNESGPARQRRRRSRVEDEGLIPVDGLDTMPAHDQAVLDRIAALTGVLPESPGRHKPPTKVDVGDIVEHAGYGASPVRITRPPVTHKDHMELTGEVIGSSAARGTVTWRPTTTRSETGEPQIQLVSLPRSLAGLIRDSASPVPEPDRGDSNEYLLVPADPDIDIDPRSAGWMHSTTRHDDSGSIERWEQGEWTLELRWATDEDNALLLSTRVLLNNGEKAIGSLADLQAIVAEGARYGTARFADGRWEVTPVPTADAAMEAPVDPDEVRRAVHRDEHRRWVFTDNGEPIDRSAGRTPADRQVLHAAKAEQFSLWDSADRTPDTRASRQPEPAVSAGPVGAERRVPWGQPRQLFEYAVGLATAALARTRDIGLHDPNAWLDYSDVVSPHPATGVTWDWWIEQATRALAELGYSVEKRNMARSAPQVTVDHDARTIVLNASLRTTHAFNLVAEVSAARRHVAAQTAGSAEVTSLVMDAAHDQQALTDAPAQNAQVSGQDADLASTSEATDPDAEASATTGDNDLAAGADTAGGETAPTLTLNDGRALDHISDSRQRDVSYLAGAAEAYVREEQGRFRLIVMRFSEPVAGRALPRPWQWTLQRIDELGNELPAITTPSKTTYATAQQALTAAQTELNKLEPKLSIIAAEQALALGQVGDPLTNVDIALALRSLGSVTFAAIVRGILAGKPYSMPVGGHGGAPDADPSVMVEHNAQGITVRARGTDAHRSGALSAQQLAAWVRTGLSPILRDIVLEADAARELLADARDGYLAIGERQQVESAYANVQRLQNFAMAEILMDAESAMGDRPPSEAERVAGPTRRVRPDVGVALFDVASDRTEHRFGEALQWLQSLSAQVPSPPSEPVAIYNLQPADVVHHPDDHIATIRLSTHPVDLGERALLTGHALDEPDERITWELPVGQPIQRVVLPTTLTPLVTVADEATDRLPQTTPHNLKDATARDPVGESNAAPEQPDEPVDAVARGTQLSGRAGSGTADTAASREPAIMPSPQPVPAESMTGASTALGSEADDGQLERVASSIPEQRGQRTAAEVPREEAEIVDLGSEAADDGQSSVPEEITDQPEQSKAEPVTINADTSWDDLADHDTATPDTAELTEASDNQTSQPAAPTTVRGDAPKPDGERRLAIYAVPLAPAGGPDTRPLSEQLAMDRMPDAIRYYEPARLTIVEAIQALRASMPDPDVRARGVINLGEDRPGEAEAVAEQLDGLADLIDSAGYTAHPDGSQLIWHLRTVASVIRQRLGTFQPGPPGAPQTPERAASEQRSAASQQDPDVVASKGGSATPLTPRSSTQDTTVSKAPPAAKSSAGQAADRPDSGTPAPEGRAVDSNEEITDQQGQIEPEPVITEVDTFWDDLADRDTATPDTAELTAASDNQISQPAAPTAPVRDEAPQLGAASVDHALSGGSGEGAGRAAEQIGHEWAEQVARAAELGITIQTRYDGASGLDGDTIYISGGQPPDARVLELSSYLAVAALRPSAHADLLAALIPAQRKGDMEFPQHAGTLDLAVTDQPALSPVTGRFTGQLDLSASATASWREASSGASWSVDGDTPLYEQLRAELGLIEDPVTTRTPRAPTRSTASRRDHPAFPGVAPGWGARQTTSFEPASPNRARSNR